MFVVNWNQSYQPKDIIGVPKGSFLGPNIFSCFINNLCFILRPEAGLFPADYTMFNSNSSPANEAVHACIQLYVNNIQPYIKWQVPLKLWVSFNDSLQWVFNHLHLIFNSITIAVSSTINIWGRVRFNMDQKLYWVNHRNSMAISMLETGFLAVSDSPLTIPFHSDKTQVRSVMKYSSLVWVTQLPKTQSSTVLFNWHSINYWNIHSLRYRCTVAAMHTIWKMCCSHSAGLLSQTRDFYHQERCGQ